MTRGELRGAIGVLEEFGLRVYPANTGTSEAQDFWNVLSDLQSTAERPCKNPTYREGPLSDWDILEIEGGRLYWRDH